MSRVILMTILCLAGHDLESSGLYLVGTWLRSSLHFLILSSYNRGMKEGPFTTAVWWPKWVWSCFIPHLQCVMEAASCVGGGELRER